MYYNVCTLDVFLHINTDRNQTGLGGWPPKPAAGAENLRPSHASSWNWRPPAHWIFFVASNRRVGSPNDYPTILFLGVQTRESDNGGIDMIDCPFLRVFWWILLPSFFWMMNRGRVADKAIKQMSSAGRSSQNLGLLKSNGSEHHVS